MIWSPSVGMSFGIHDLSTLKKTKAKKPKTPYAWNSVSAPRSSVQTAICYRNIIYSQHHILPSAAAENASHAAAVSTDRCSDSAAPTVRGSAMRRSETAWSHQQLTAPTPASVYNIADDGGTSTKPPGEHEADIHGSENKRRRVSPSFGGWRGQREGRCCCCWAADEDEDEGGIGLLQFNTYTVLPSWARRTQEILIHVNQKRLLLILSHRDAPLIFKGYYQFHSEND